MIAKAHAKDLLTTPYVFSEPKREAMAHAGADIIVCHLGLTTGGSIGAETREQARGLPGLIDAWAEAALKVHPDVLILVHGGPIAEPERRGFHHEGTARPVTASTAPRRWSACRSSAR